MWALPFLFLRMSRAVRVATKAHWTCWTKSGRNLPSMDLSSEGWKSFSRSFANTKLGKETGKNQNPSWLSRLLIIHIFQEFEKVYAKEAQWRGHFPEDTVFRSRRPLVKTFADSKALKRPVKFSNSNVDKTLLPPILVFFRVLMIITGLLDFYGLYIIVLWSVISIKISVFRRSCLHKERYVLY